MRVGAERQKQSWFWNVFKEEVGSKLTQAFWSCSVTEKAVRMMEKLKVDLYFLSWDETGKCVGRQNITWKSKCPCQIRYYFLKTLKDSNSGFFFLNNLLDFL